ncbi:hypothetical protein DPMN_183131 [Dreissena polymorpha]|uniref:Uncharacterized protein n=1 Tax=Dreissena polymorpha TaxID=45954 RepID=A0A9D4DIE5_DREPO|nr:hypothetical protein DPMN_182597 [Dreissena polymorpha]KAH3748682.1 hypothetical protein DPMN_183131 [Dreissena polymorpha]
MTLNAQKDFLDPLLLQAVYWLTNENAFQEAGDTEHILNAKCLAIASDISTLVTSVPSPKHLGLAVHLYNDFGSRHLIEDMFNLGYSISYPELRKFLTSAAEHGMNSHEKMICLLSKMFEGTLLDPFDTKQRLTVS